MVRKALSMDEGFDGTQTQKDFEVYATKMGLSLDKWRDGEAFGFYQNKRTLHCWEEFQAERGDIRIDGLVGSYADRMMPPVSDTLLAFLEEWLVWAKFQNCKSNVLYRSVFDDVFNVGWGLCDCLRQWAMKFSKGKLSERLDCVEQLTGELNSAFEKGGYDKYYPFGEVNYDQRICTRDQHLDPARLEWVEKTITITKREAVKKKKDRPLKYTGKDIDTLIKTCEHIISREDVSVHSQNLRDIAEIALGVLTGTTEQGKQGDKDA